MLKLIKGDPENLEGKAIVYTSNLYLGPFVDEKGSSFYPAQFIYSFKDNPIEMRGRTLALKPKQIERLKTFSFDVLYAGEIHDLSYAIAMTKSASNIYSMHYLSQQHKKRNLKEEPELARKDLSQLTEEEYKEALKKMQRKAFNIFLLGRDPKKYLDELVYLAQNNMEIKGDVAALSDIAGIYCKSGGSKDTKELIKLYFIKISHIIYEEYEKAGEISSKINALLLKRAS